MDEQLKQYIYESTPAEYAVLVTGPWGCGKTFFIKDFIEKNLGKYRRNEMNRYDPIPTAYISLNGKSTIDQVRVDLLATINPGIFKTAKGSEFLASAALAQFKIRQSFNFINKIRFPHDTILFLDDLERWEGNFTTIMGFVNRLVEHEKIKVILIADEEKINQSNLNRTVKPDQSFSFIKEKTIGKTIHFSQDYQILFRRFIDSVTNGECQKYLNCIHNDIFEIFKKSKTNNLRILIRTIEDFQHLWNLLDHEKLEKKDNFTRFVKQYFMFQIEFKKGNYTVADLKDYNDLYAIMGDHNTNTNMQKLDVISTKYIPITSFDFYSAAKEFWIEEILNNSLNSKTLDEAMRLNGSYKISGGRLWAQLWYYWQLPANEFRSLIETVQEAISKMEITVPGEVLHVFLTLDSLHKDNIILYPNALTRGREYIDDLLENGKLPGFIYEENTNFNASGYGGLSYANESNEETISFIQYLENKQKEKTNSDLSTLATTLLEDLKNDVTLFCDKICEGNKRSKYYATPIFTKMNVEKFSRALIQLHPQKQRSVFFGLKRRYESRKGDLGELIKEREFLERVKQYINIEIPNLDPLDQKRLENRITKSIDSSISLLKNCSPPQTTH